MGIFDDTSLTSWWGGIVALALTGCVGLDQTQTRALTAPETAAREDVPSLLTAANTPTERAI